MGLREVKVTARTKLQGFMSVRANYYLPDGSPATIANIRVHSKIHEAGDLQGTSLSYAQSLETEPTVLFWASEVNPTRKAVVTISDTEAYRVTAVEPLDLLSISCPCARLPEAEIAASYPPPPPA